MHLFTTTRDHASKSSINAQYATTSYARGGTDKIFTISCLYSMIIVLEGIKFYVSSPFDILLNKNHHELILSHEFY